MLKASLVTLFLFSTAPVSAMQEAGLPPLDEEVVVEENTALQALRKVQTYMEKVRSLEAIFQQRAPDGNVAHGTLYMARPGRIRFDYKDDIPFLVVADGKSLNFVDYEIGQVTKWPVKDTPLRALLGNSTDLASINANIDIAPEGVVGLIALSAADPDKPEMGQVTLYFEEAPDLLGGLKLLSWVVLDAQNKMTSVELSSQSVNGELADSLWTFKDPRGLAKRRKNRR